MARAAGPQHAPHLGQHIHLAGDPSVIEHIEDGGESDEALTNGSGRLMFGLHDLGMGAFLIASAIAIGEMSTRLGTPLNSAGHSAAAEDAGADMDGTKK
jgi:hypothetical protein